MRKLKPGEVVEATDTYLAAEVYITLEPGRLEPTAQQAEEARAQLKHMPLRRSPVRRSWIGCTVQSIQRAPAEYVIFRMSAWRAANPSPS